MNKIILPGSNTKASPANPLMSQLFKKWWTYKLLLSISHIMT